MVKNKQVYSGLNECTMVSFAERQSLSWYRQKLQTLKEMDIIFRAYTTKSLLSLTLSSTAQVICDLAFLNAYSSKIS
jgi:hypothetical protein